MKLSCTDARSRLHDALDGTLPPAARQGLAHHLAGCGPCRQEAGRRRALLDLLSRLPPPPVPPLARASLLHAFHGFSQ